MHLFPCILALANPGSTHVEHFYFRVRAGQTAQRTFEATHEMRRTRRRLFQDGNEVLERPRHEDEFTATVIEEQRRVVTDEILEVHAGMPRRTLRSFDTIETSVGTFGEYMFGGHPEPHTSELAGRRFLVEWNDVTQRFGCMFADGADKPPPDCVEDMDFRAFLPTREVTPGQQWEPPGAVWMTVLAAGGRAGLTVPPSRDWEVDRIPAHLWIDHVDGWVNAMFVGTEQQDGVRVGKIQLVGEVETSAVRQAGPSEQGLWTSMHYTVKTRYELRGELLWDLDEGCMRSVSLSGPCKVEKTLTTAFDWMEMSNVTREDHEFEGTSTFTAELTRR